MNKDVIYIEPEDDITDIISRIKSSKQKVVALVPPKKLGIMRSAVNTKLIAKTAKSLEKVAVVVTTDPSLIKLSALSGIPVAKTLSSRPMLPSEFTKRKKKETEELEEAELDKPAEDDSNAEEVIDEKKGSKKDDMALDSDEVENDDDEEEKKDKKKKKKDVELIPNFDKYRKWIIFGGAGVVLLTAALIWAFIIAPAAKITIKMKAVSSNISENVTLVTDEKNKDNKAGKFLLEQLKYEEEISGEFEATGKANKGDKAKGSVNVYALFPMSKPGGSSTLAAGTTIKIGGNNYVTASAYEFSWDGVSANCNDRRNDTCYIKTKTAIPVTAVEPGASYNIAAAGEGGGSVAAEGYLFAGSSAMAEGSDRNVTVVSEKDIEDKKSVLVNGDEVKASKDKFLEQIEDGFRGIDSSYKVEIKEATSAPKKGEEVSDKKKFKLTIKVVHTIYVVDRTAIDEYIKEFEKDKIGENDKIYSTGIPFFERFLEGKDGTFTAKLKTTVKIGPNLSESLVLDTVKGKKVGEVKALIKDISSNIKDDGVSIEPSFPWVYWVPDDANRIKIDITVEE